MLALTLCHVYRYYPALMLDQLPKRVEPVGLCDAGRSFRGEIAVEAFQRLRPLLADSGGVLEVRLVFRVDERRVRVLEGSIDGCVQLVCQRCLQALAYPLQVQFRLGIVGQEAYIDQLPDRYEPLVVTGEPLPMVEVIEDEVLLAIPAVPMHTGAAMCSSGYRNQPLPEKEHPFASLEKLKT